MAASIPPPRQLSIAIGDDPEPIDSAPVGLVQIPRPTEASTPLEQTEVLAPAAPCRKASSRRRHSNRVEAARRYATTSASTAYRPMPARPGHSPRQRSSWRSWSLSRYSAGCYCASDCGTCTPARPHTRCSSSCVALYASGNQTIQPCVVGGLALGLWVSIGVAIAHAARGRYGIVRPTGPHMVRRLTRNAVAIAWPATPCMYARQRFVCCPLERCHAHTPPCTAVRLPLSHCGPDPAHLTRATFLHRPLRATPPFPIFSIGRKQPSADPSVIGRWCG